MKYAGDWRLYLNTPVRMVAEKDIGDIAKSEIAFDAEERKVKMHPKLVSALIENQEAKNIFRQSKTLSSKGNCSIYCEPKYRRFNHKKYR